MRDEEQRVEAAQQHTSTAKKSQATMLAVCARTAHAKPGGAPRRLRLRLGEPPAVVGRETLKTSLASSPQFADDPSADFRAQQRLPRLGGQPETGSATRGVRKFGHVDLQGNPGRSKRVSGEGKSAAFVGRARATAPRELNVPTITMAAMAALGVRSGSRAFARPKRIAANDRFQRTGAHARERPPLFAMQEVVGSSPIIRFFKPKKWLHIPAS